jgi:hypothetical protein
MEDIITNFELVGTRLLRICPCCGQLQDKAYDLGHEQAVLREQCPRCGFHFPYLTEQPSSFAVFKDLDEAGTPNLAESATELDATDDRTEHPEPVTAGL